MPEKKYVDTLLKDLHQDIARYGARPVHSIFMGGGTPSLFSGDAMTTLLDGIRALLPLDANAEITLEANPGTVDNAHFIGYRQAGINRLSIGVQSFDAAQLKILGRIHDSAQALNAVSVARNAGFKNINLDIMHGLPNQTVEAAMHDLQQAIDCNPTHLSWYELTLEPNTLFHRHPPKTPDGDTLWTMQEQGKGLLQQSGFSQYEVSAYAKPNKQCQHNLTYWRFGDYYGIGAGAHSKLTDPRTGDIVRLTKYKQPKQYLAAQAISDIRYTNAGMTGINRNSFMIEERTLEQAALPFEYMLNVLRLQAPVSRTHFERSTGLSFDMLQPALAGLTAKELVVLTPDGFTLTDHGHRFLNDVVSGFL